MAPHHRACAVHLCHSNTSNKPVSYFSFPKDSKRCELWVTACRNRQVDHFFKTKGADYMYRRYKVCSQHFKNTDFRNPYLTSQGIFPSAVPSLKLKYHFDSKSGKLRTDPDGDDQDTIIKEKSSNSAKLLTNETTNKFNLPNVSCDINPLLVSHPVFDPSNREQTSDSIENDCIEPTGTASTNSKIFDSNSLDNITDVLREKLETSHKILIDTQKENHELKKQISKVKHIVKNHETRYGCLEEKFNQSKEQILRLKRERKTLMADGKKCVISTYVNDDSDKRVNSTRYTEADKFFSIALYSCSKLVYKALQKHFLLPSVFTINEWLLDTNIIEECKRKVPEAEMFRDSEAEVNSDSELIKMEYIQVGENHTNICLQQITE